MNGLAGWWADLAVRERGLVLAGAAVLLASSVFLGVLEPLSEHNQQREKALLAQSANLRWLEDQRPLVAAGRGITPVGPDAGRSILAVLNEAASAEGVAAQLKRVTPVSEQQVMLSFEDVPYANFMRWLRTLERQRGARVERIHLAKTALPGQINVELTLGLP